jgi:hypothetical protein
MNNHDWPDHDWPDTVLSPEARADLRRVFRLTDEGVDLLMAEMNRNTRAEFWAYRASHPTATPQDFARAMIDDAWERAVERMRIDPKGA